MFPTKSDPPPLRRDVCLLPLLLLLLLLLILLLQLQLLLLQLLLLLLRLLLLLLPLLLLLLSLRLPLYRTYSVDDARGGSNTGNPAADTAATAGGGAGGSRDATYRPPTPGRRKYMEQNGQNADEVRVGKDA